jgi:lysine-ketoglutarate reductase/saccharopine dehydrogenase-like protein (TIGR00300 family)
MFLKGADPPKFTEEIELSGHIIDSLILPKVLDCITAVGAEFKIKRFTIGQGRGDPSFALIEIQATSAKQLQGLLAELGDHGAVPTSQSDVRCVAADCEGAFPEGFYSTTNQRTQIRLAGDWIDVQNQEMDCAILVAPQLSSARCVPMTEVQRGQTIVVGHAGVRVIPFERDTARQSFEFMNSAVSTEKPKGVAIRKIAQQMVETRAAGGKILVVGGPAIVHTGSVEHFCECIRLGYVQRLFAGNALATHDIEQAFFGTSLGVDLGHGDSVPHGHEHHLRAINRIRRVGGIDAAVEQGLLRSGIMYECVKHNVEFLLAGSIRDDGPLTDVITDTLVAQQRMREAIRDVSFCLMIATTLHSIAVGNLLPAWIPVVCIDINPSTIIKLNDRGSFQTTGLVTDVEPFMRALLEEIRKLTPSKP